MPQAEGHLLVVPKAPSRNLLDADAATLPALIATVQKLAVAAKDAFDADGVTVMQFNEAPAGQSVFHLHFHVIPRRAGVPLKPHSGTMEDGAVLAANAERFGRRSDRASNLVWKCLSPGRLHGSADDFSVHRPSAQVSA